MHSRPWKYGHKAMLQKKIGLQSKSVLLLAVVVLATATGSEWLYCSVTAQILQQNDRHRAEGLARGLAVAARPALLEQDRPTLQQLSMDLLQHPNVHCVEVIGPRGGLLAEADRIHPSGRRCTPTGQPVSLSYLLRRSGNFLEVGRPVSVSQGTGPESLVGAVRLILDTEDTAAIMTGLQQRALLITAAIIFCMIPLGHLLVWRLIVCPIRHLLRATCRLAKGDFSVRVNSSRGDEIGELASSFDSMAESLHASRRQLQEAKESLEREVAERTGELERANRRLREEMAEKEDFLRAVSHDLNAPLRNITGMAAMITTNWRDQLPEQALHHLQRIQANVEVQSELIAELLELSQIKTQREARQVVDFGALLEDLRGAFEYELKAKNIELKIHPPMPKLTVEPKRMRQMFQNLLDNAIKFMGSRTDARIEINCRQADGMYLFDVADNGPGIAPEDRESIFYVFRRAATAATASVPGKGVGLALVRSIASSYDGRVWVDSAPGEGSTFHVAISAGCTECPVEHSPHDAEGDETEYVGVGERAENR